MNNIKNITWGKNIGAKKSQPISPKIITEASIDVTKSSNQKQILKTSADGTGLVEDLLQSLGKKAFINLYPELHSGDEVDMKKLALENPDSASWSTLGNRISTGQRIFKLGLEKEALQIIQKSKKLDDDIRRLAERYLDELENPDPSEQSESEDI